MTRPRSEMLTGTRLDTGTGTNLDQKMRLELVPLTGTKARSEIDQISERVSDRNKDSKIWSWSVPVRDNDQNKIRAFWDRASTNTGKFWNREGEEEEPRTSR